MKIISKKEFMPTVCVCYTILSLGKIIVEYMTQGRFGNFQANMLVMFVISLAATFVLSQHYRFERFPLLAVILVQYLLLLAGVMTFIWLSSFWTEVHPDGYHDMFWSFTIPYIIGAGVYYLGLFHEIKKADRLLQEYKENKI